MDQEQRSLYGTVFSLVVVALAAYVTQRFFLPLLWAVILAVASWPLYQGMRRRLGVRRLAAAALSAVIVASVFVLPAVMVIREAARQAPAMAEFIADASQNGIETPAFLARIPLAGPYLYDWWAHTLAQPHGLGHLLTDRPHGRLGSASDLLRSFSISVFHRVIDFGFAILCLFFFYKDGDALSRQINALGAHCLGLRRWQRYVSIIPPAIRATVNGLVLVGLGEGALLGIAYAIAGVPSAILWGALTGALAIIPFGAPLAYLAAAVLLLVQGQAAAAAAIAAWGTAVLFIADHFVRPRIIGSATRLPFLAVLFGILGGVEMLGLIGLFIGPVVMVLFVTLWREPAEAEAEAAPGYPGNNAV
jgi:predicted PurR-regulated permease PerM